jgi:predicted AlkP superfamily phosphohydrolase/phosphomutase
MQVAVLDVPKCRAPRPLNGIHLVDWLTHGEYFQSPRGFPHSLVDEVLQKFGPRSAHQCDYFELEIDRKEPDKIVTQKMFEISMKRSAGLHYLNSKAWDLFCIAFSQLHCINHEFWDSHSIPPIDDLRIRNKPIFEVLQGIDEAIGALISAAGPEADCIVVAPTDFELNGSWQHLMPEIIARINCKLSKQFGRPARLKWPFARRI